MATDRGFSGFLDLIGHRWGFLQLIDKMVEQGLFFREVSSWNGLKDIVILLSECFEITNILSRDFQLKEVTFTQHTNPIPFKLEMFEDHPKHNSTAGHTTSCSSFRFNHLLEKNTKPPSLTRFDQLCGNLTVSSWESGVCL